MNCLGTHFFVNWCAILSILTLSVWTGNDQAGVSGDGYSESTSTADLQQGQYQQRLFINM